MAKIFTFSKLSKMGEFDEKYGQSYWGEPNEQVTPVKFNSMNQDITFEDTIEAEEVLIRTSSKGTEYHQLKKVRVVGGSQNLPERSPPAVAVTAGVAMNLSQEIKDQWNRIEEKLDRLLGEADDTQ